MPWLGPDGKIMDDATLSAMAQREARMRAVEEAARIEAAKKFGILDQNGNPIDAEPDPPPAPRDADDAKIERHWREQAAKRNGVLQTDNLAPMAERIDNEAAAKPKLDTPIAIGGRPEPQETLMVLRRIVTDGNLPVEEVLNLVKDVLAHPERYRIES